HSKHSKRAATVYRKLATSKNIKLSDLKINKIMRQASPSSYVSKNVCPIILIHGAKDKVVFIDSTDEFYKAMQAADADITYLRFHDAGHGVMGQKGSKTMPAMHHFFEKHLNTH
ncbi:prolyl oligopeptidase family serine peptidase, partial [uncultured Gimesia sp.]|uniref:alpha/beta hydrolase family protein n=1 Tax=uncultured Gimesia sp. TaxID=1678688 RepID=UPI0026380A7D